MRPRLLPSRRPALAALLAASGLTLASPMLAPTLAVAQAPAGTLRDFRLPPDADAPTEQPAPQGPVAPDVPASGQVVVPTPPTATLSATPTPAPTASAVVQPLPAASPIVSPDVALPTAPARQTPRTTGQSTAAPTVTRPPEQEAGVAAAAPSATSSAATPFPVPLSPPAAKSGAELGGLPWLWIGATLLTVAGLGLIAALLRRRLRAGRTRIAHEIERPTLTPQPIALSSPPQPANPLPVEPASAAPITNPGLEMELEPQRLSLTLMNATLSYRLLLNNRGAEPVEGLTITADMIAAHAALSREEQLSGPDANAMQVASIARLEPGESRIVGGEFRLPFGQITPIRQGDAALLFPLARFRIEGVKLRSLTRTFLVAQPPIRPGAGLQPFRLDLGPRVYPNLAQRAFA